MSDIRTGPLEDRLHRDFTAHEVDAEAAKRMAAIRGAAWRLATLIAETTPAGREQSLAITKLEEAVFWGNAAISRADD